MTGENVGLQRIWNEDLVIRAMKKAEALTAFFVLIFTGKTGHQPPQGSWDQWESPEQGSLSGGGLC